MRSLGHYEKFLSSLFWLRRVNFGALTIHFRMEVQHTVFRFVSCILILVGFVLIRLNNVAVGKNNSYQLIFRHSDTFNTTLDEKSSENSIESVNLGKSHNSSWLRYLCPLFENFQKTWGEGGSSLAKKSWPIWIMRLPSEITKLFSCQHNCATENQVPELSDRKVLPKQWPSESLHKKWGTRNGYIAGLHIYNNTELTTEEDEGLLKEARIYVETFWKNHTEKNPLQFDAAKFEDPIPELYHYTWFNCRTFKLVHYISLLSSLRNMIDERARIVFHTDCEPDLENNEHWRNLKTLAKDKLAKDIPN